MNVTIPDTIAEAAGLNEKSALVELAFALYAQGRISPGHVRRMAGINFYEFERIALERGLPTNTLSDESWELELQTLNSIKRL